MRATLLLLALSAAGVTISSAQDVCRLPLSKTTQLLGGRLEVALPAVARNEQRQVSVMAAPDAIEEQTRIVIGGGNDSIVLMAWELFATAGSDFEQSVRADVHNAPLTVSPLPSSAHLHGFELVPNPSAPKGNLLYGAYVANPDGTVQRLGLYVKDGAHHSDACLALAREIVASVQDGERELPLKGGLTKLGEDLTLDLPDGFVPTRQVGPDFVVYKIHKLVPLGSTGATLGIYVGGAPSYHGGTGKAVKLLGVATQWEEQRAAGKANAQALVKKEYFFHFFIEAGSEDDLLALEHIAEAAVLH